MARHIFELDINGSTVAYAPTLEHLAGIVAQPQIEFRFAVREVCPGLLSNDNEGLVRVKSISDLKRYDIKTEILQVGAVAPASCPCTLGPVSPRHKK